MSTKRIFSVLFVAAVVAATMGVSVDTANAAIFETAAKVQEGEIYAADPMFDSVGFMYTKIDDLWHRAGSGVLIDPEWALVAGHSLLLGGGIEETSGVEFYLGNNLFESSTGRIADEWYTYPGYTAGHTAGHGVDLGLIHLSEPIFSVDPAVLYNGVDLRGTLMQMAGYGSPGTAISGPGNFDGIKRAGSNIAAEFGGDRPPWHRAESQYWLADFDLFYDDLQPLEWMTSPGDSGGGWFADFDGQMQLVGINHGFLGDYGSGVSMAIRTSLYDDWINETMTSVPEPSSIVMFASLGLTLLLFRKRFRRVC